MKSLVSMLIHSFLHLQNIRIDILRIQEAYTRHPLPHSIRSLSDTLDELKVENAVYRLEFEQLFEIEGAFIVVAGRDEYPFYIVEDLDRATNTVALRTATGKHVKLSFDQFRAVWDGTVLMAEKGERTREDSWPVYWIKQGLWFVERTAMYWVAAMAACVLVGAVLQTSSLGELRYPLKVAGIVVSLLVIVKSSFDPRRFQRFCRLGTRADCNEVLSSPEASILGWVSLGELSLVYFAASLLWGVFLATDPEAVFPVLDISAVLFVAYSLLWQIRHNKWCSLCLLIDLVLIVDLVGELLLWGSIRNVTQIAFYPDSVSFALVFAICLLATKRIVGMAEQNRTIAQLNFKIERLLSSPELFWQLLYEHPPQAVDSRDIPTICNGLEAEHTITVVMNPSCPKCAKVHEAVASLDGYRINLVFVVNDGDERSHQAALVMISAGRKYAWTAVDRIIRNWYEKQELPHSPEVHGEAGNDLEQQRKYCNTIGVEGTPTVLVDNRRLPELYDIQDLKILL